MTYINRPEGRERGFTLIELLVVVVIFSLLALMVSSNVLSSADAIRGDRGQSVLPEEITLVARLLDFAGLAVLLFGAGFWYLVELHAPGRLDKFRLGHFLLLALTYSLFFAVFAVLGSHEVEAWLAVTIAATVSYPLLVLHVSTIIGFRFALTSALPLAVITTGIVVNGVYGGDLRSYVYLGMACGVITVLTLTYPRLARGQEARRRRLEQQLSDDVDQLAPAATAARARLTDTRMILALEDPAEHSALRDWVEQRLAAVQMTLEAHERMVTYHDDMRSAATRAEGRMSRLNGMTAARRLVSQLPQSCTALREATTALVEQRRAHLRLTPDTSESEHCIACGHVCVAGSDFCPGCGTRCAEARPCRRCDQILRLPMHLLTSDREAGRPATFCFGCGERHVG